MKEAVSSFMCHNIDTQERFYALHKNVTRAKTMRDIFINLSLRHGEPEEAGMDDLPSTSGEQTKRRSMEGERPKKVSIYGLSMG